MRVYMSQGSAEVQARITPSPARRIVTTLLLLVIGGLLIDSSFANMSQVTFAALTFLFGMLSIGLAFMMYAYTRHSIELHPQSVKSSDGTVLAEFENISGIEIGMLAFKPASGCTIKLHNSMPAVWRVGLWWRYGRMVGIGGCTPKGEVKQFATLLQAQLLNKSSRDQG